MKPNAHPRRESRLAFTLVEMLVAMLVLSLMVAGLATATSYVTGLWLSSTGAVDNFTKARVVLNLLDRDVQTMVMRRDLAAFVTNSSGNATCSFYANVPGNPGTGFSGGTYDTRSVSLVQYLLTNSTTAPTLLRYNYGVNFITNTATAAIPTVGTTTTLVAPANSTLQSDPIFTGIMQFQWQFLDGTGTLQPTYSYNYTQPSAPSNSRILVISLAVVSNPAYIVANKTGNMAALAGCFSTNTPTNQTYSQVWNAFLNAPSATFLSMPEPVRKGVRVFERHIPLPITTPTS